MKTFTNVDQATGDIKTWARLGHPSTGLANLHSSSGPAIIRKNGNVEWFYEGWQVSFDTWCRLTNKAPEEILVLKLQYF